MLTLWINTSDKSAKRNIEDADLTICYLNLKNAIHESIDHYHGHGESPVLSAGTNMDLGASGVILLIFKLRRCRNTLSQWLCVILGHDPDHN
jgi:hypothetical protein